MATISQRPGKGKQKYTDVGFLQDMEGAVIFLRGRMIKIYNISPNATIRTIRGMADEPIKKINWNNIKKTKKEKEEMEPKK